MITALQLLKMRSRFSGLLKAGPGSFRHLALLSASTTISQLIIAVSSVALTRIYSAADFGLFAVFSALSALIGMVVSLRYEYAISTCLSEAAVFRIISICVLCTFITSTAVGLGVFMFASTIGHVTGSPDLPHLLWLLPVTLTFQGISLPIEYLLIHRGRIQPNAFNRLIHAVGQVSLQILLGLFCSCAAGLIIGYVGGYLLRMCHFLLQLSTREFRQIMRPQCTMLMRDARKNWQYPVYSSGASILQGGTLLLPSIFLAALYGPTVAGWFGLGQRVIALPVRLLGQTASQIFLSEAPRMDDLARYRHFIKIVRIFSICGVLGLSPLMVFGGSLFAFVFGEEWRAAGIIVQIVAPFQWARFVVVPVSQILNLKGKQSLHLLAAAVGMAAMLVSMCLGWAWSLGVLSTVAIYSVGSTSATLLYLAFVWRAAKPTC